jgi:hypothetical protein
LAGCCREKRGAKTAAAEAACNCAAVRGEELGGVPMGCPWLVKRLPRGPIPANAIGFMKGAGQLKLSGAAVEGIGPADAVASSTG